MTEGLGGFIKAAGIIMTILLIWCVILTGFKGYDYLTAEEVEHTVTVVDKYTKHKSGSTMFINGMFFRSGGGTRYYVTVELEDGSTMTDAITTKSYNDVVIGGCYKADILTAKDGDLLDLMFKYK